VTLEKKLQQLRAAAAASKEPKAVANLREVMARFIPLGRAFSSRSRSAQVASDGRRTVMLFDNGRWTVDIKFTSLTLGHPNRTERRYDRRRGVAEVGDYLELLTKVGLVAAEDAQTFKQWKAATFDAQQRREDLSELITKARVLGCRVVVGKR